MTSNLADKIWFTAKTRMVSEKRYRLYDITSHLFLTYTSLLIIFSSVFAEKLENNLIHFQPIMISLSLIIFTTSIVVYGFRFSETANKYRECYLRLQRLSETLEKQTDPELAYHEILEHYPNHAPRDYEKLVLARTLLEGRTLRSGSEEITWTMWMLISHVLRFFTFWALVLIIPALLTSVLVLPFFDSVI